MDSNEELQPHELKGPLAWAAQNHVFANLLMLALLFGGVMMLPQIKQEVFPEFDLDIIQVRVAYPGAAPEEVEQGVILAIEEAVRGVDGVKRVTSTAAESYGAVMVELMLGEDRDQALSDVERNIDRITSLPEDAEEAEVSLLSSRSQVISVVVYGDLSEETIREYTEQVRRDLLDKSEITEATLDGVRPFEISVEVPRENLRRYGLTLNQIAQTLSQASIDLPGGSINSDSGEILLRTTERRQTAEGFEDITVATSRDGSAVKVRDIGRAVDGFEENDVAAYYNGVRAARVNIFRVGEQTPLDIAAAVNEYVELMNQRLPESVRLATWNDSSELYAQRVDLLVRNGKIGLILVLLILAMFLEPRLAFWVTLGIPISFLGAMLFMQPMDVSINMISLFAFIVTLGIVVDDAIVAGEAIYYERQRGTPPLQAAIRGIRSVAAPITFSVLTTMIAFMPMLFVPGASGKFFRVIPLVVIAVLGVSLIEALFILPAHLSGLKDNDGKFYRGVLKVQGVFTGALDFFIQRVYRPVLIVAVEWRWATLGIFIAMLIVAMGYVAGGRVKFIFIPDIESDIIQANLQMPFGSSVEDTKRVVGLLVDESREVFDELDDPEMNSRRGIYARVGEQEMVFGDPTATGGTTGGHLGQVQLMLVSSDDREFSAGEFTSKWRERVADVAGIDTLNFIYKTGPSGGKAITFELSHHDQSVLERASHDLAMELQQYAGVFDVDDGVEIGKQQIDIELKPGARQLGISEAFLANQIRAAFYGAEATRQQRGRYEVRTYVRLPRHERESLEDLEDFVVRSPEGGEISLRQAATLDVGRSFTTIQREDGRRVISVTADVDGAVTTAGEVVGSIEANILPALQQQYEGLRYSLGGDQEEQAESIAALRRGFLLAIIAMYFLMGVAFKSYAQPIVIMSAIPFGFIGALGGHVLLGMKLSLMSMMGVVALSGVVVNDSLVLISAVNDFRRNEGMGIVDAVVAGGVRRFRPILLTSLTTFFGLSPMILETSVQAKFLIPMAVSLGFGVLFATFVILMLVPALYRVVEDVRHFTGWLVFNRTGPADVPGLAHPELQNGDGPIEPPTR